MLTILSRQEGNAVVLSLLGYLEFSSIADMRKELHRTLSKQAPKLLVINLEKVRFIDSSGVGSLLNAHNVMKTNGGALHLCALDPKMRNISDSLGISKLLAIFPAESEALGGLSSLISWPERHLFVPCA
jgi:stage II sporulation protein AA (anti-sigma F factor antagonist)